MSAMKVAVVGCGYWGKNLVRNFHALGALAAVCDASEACLERLAAEYPGVTRHQSYKDILADPAIAGVVLATHAASHASLAVEALEAGKHVFVEKPLALDLAQGRRVVEEADRRGLVLMVGHLLQYHPAFLRLQEMAVAGDLGRINYVCSHRLNLGKIRSEENILWSFAPHDISMILSLAGEEPHRVSATGASFLQPDVADITLTHLEFPSGAKGHIFVSWLHPFKEQKLVLVGEAKMAVFDDSRPWEEKLMVYPHRVGWNGGAPCVNRADGLPVALPQVEPLREECGHFLQCLETGSRPRTDGEEGLRVLRVLRAAQQSLESGAASGDEAAPVVPAGWTGDVAMIAERSVSHVRNSWHNLSRS